MRSNAKCFTVIFNGEGITELFAHAGLPAFHSPAPGQSVVTNEDIEGSLKVGTTYKECIQTIEDVFKAHPEKRFAGIFKEGKFFDLMVR